MTRNELIQHCIAAWNLDGSGSIESRMSKAMDIVLEEAGKVADSQALLIATREAVLACEKIATAIRALKLPHTRTECEIADATPSRATGGLSVEWWVIRKNGYFYRPNYRGYTASVHEAGRYHKTDALCAQAREKKVTAHPLSEFLADAPPTGERDAVMEAEGREITRQLMLGADDPMWSDHCEMPKSLAKRAANFIERHIGRTG